MKPIVPKSNSLKYGNIKSVFKRPFVWKKPESEKANFGGINFSKYHVEKDSFERLKIGIKEEVMDNLVKHLDVSNDRNELNQRLDVLWEHYSKGVIPTNDFDPKFLLGKTNRNTLAKKLQPWCKNLVFNIPEIIRSKPFQDLVMKFHKVPAFVVLAGPSLKNNRKLLQEAKGKALIISVDTSLRPLLDVGVVPDICVTHDANPNGCKFFLSKEHPLNTQNINLNVKSDEEVAATYALLQRDTNRLNFKYDTLGLFVNYCHPITLLAFNGREKRFYGVTDPTLPVYDCMAACSNYKESESKLTPENKGRVIGGSSVGHVATYIAGMLGCSPISFLGLDLSYPGGKTYVDGASNQKSVKNQKLVKMQDLSGNEVETNISMLSYKMVFEQALPHLIACNPYLVLYNCTENSEGKPAGILECGAEPKPLRWVLDNYCKEKKEVKINYE